MLRPITVLACATIATAALAEEPRRHVMVETGADFCIMRDYGAAHMASHPRQLVTSLRIMGRNAWRGQVVSDKELFATARVTFRDRKEPLSLYGRCFENDDEPGLMKCSFVPGEFQDVLGQVVRLRHEGGRIKATVSSDWTVIRAGKEPDGPYGKPKSDDATFLLDRRPIEACGPSPEEWNADGPTPALLEKLP